MAAGHERRARNAMSERMSPGHRPAIEGARAATSSVSASSSVAHESRPLSPADLAREAVASLGHSTVTVAQGVEALRAALAANDLGRWTAAREQLDQILGNAARSSERARARTSDAGPDASQELAIAETRLRELRATADTLHVPPLGFEPISRETDLVRVLAAPLEGGFRTGFDKKEAELRAEIDQLAPAEARTIADRLRRPREKDLIPQYFARLTAGRQRGLLDYLDHAPRREALRQGAPHPDSSAPPQAALAGTAITAGTEQPPAAIDVESLDTRLRRILEASDATELQITTAFGNLDASERRELTRRLERYRQGSGDDVAARFARLDRPVRHRLLAVLASEHAATPGTASASVLDAQVSPPTHTAQSTGEVKPVVASRQVPTVEAEEERLAKLNPTKLHAVHETAERYFALHLPAFLAAVRMRLSAAQLGTGNAQVSWAHGADPFVDELSFALAGPDASALPGLVWPDDPWRLIDERRSLDIAEPDGPRLGAMEWNPTIGLAIAGAVEFAVRRSLPRMSARYASAAAFSGGYPTAADLIGSHPIDRVVAVAMCGDDVVRIHAAKRPPKGARGHDPQRDPLRLLESFEWLGERDPMLWNWIRVKAPLDITAEEIAATFWGKTEFAYALVMSLPLVGIPATWAEAIKPSSIRRRTPRTLTSRCGRRKKRSRGVRSPTRSPSRNALACRPGSLPPNSHPSQRIAPA